ncbi:hypothetical protein KXD40_008122 [Peronospora effusa]|uniref:Uncharacterized protein n=1 Tax=Peronospora effusa TaxID=542832 RepID=A0A3M6VBW2_9STRA|nr:hypothetical protein DD238_005643 [Peronospora effusa]RQM12606.1 hypothetical protein DD237_004146 [Peronospora effusa]UIZ23983.1 hypothetical protein KXD40_008122 [Peronospora effusa]
MSGVRLEANGSPRYAAGKSDKDDSNVHCLIGSDIRLVMLIFRVDGFPLPLRIQRDESVLDSDAKNNIV